MSDKEFWTQAYFEAYKTMLATRAKKLFGVEDDNDYELTCTDGECAICSEIADIALEYFQIRIQKLAIEAKNDIAKKEEQKKANSQRFK